MLAFQYVANGDNKALIEPEFGNVIPKKIVIEVIEAVPGEKPYFEKVLVAVCCHECKYCFLAISCIML